MKKFGFTWFTLADMLINLQANTWYTLTLLADDVRGFTAEVMQTSNPAVRGSYNVGMPAGLTWRFQAWVWTGNLFLDDYSEFVAGPLAREGDERTLFTYDALDRVLSAQPDALMYGQGYMQSYGYNPIGNIISTTMLGTYGYPASGANSVHPHAVTHLNNVQKYWYDANGNMTSRTENGTTYTQQWTVENRLDTVTGNGHSAQYLYDGDGQRVKKVQDGQTTVYLGALFEKNVSTGVTTTYYFAGSTRLAVRQGGVLSYLAGDHLGSTSLTLDASGNKIGEMKYYPYGETRPGYPIGNVPTDRRFTGQRQEDAAALGSLYDYGARFYSPAVGRFLSADTVVPKPENPQTLNRYSYVTNSPLKYIDPSGHVPCDGEKSGTERCTQATQREKINADGASLIERACSAPGMHCNPSLGETLAFGAVGFTVMGLMSAAPEAVGWLLDKIGLGATVTAAGAAETATTAACADGNCANEIESVAEITSRVFWSGGGKLAEQAAEMWARANNAVTMRMTEVGQKLGGTIEELISTSTKYAQEASGEVHVFQASEVLRRSIWALYEYPELIKNPNVTKIIFHVVMSDGTVVDAP